jgi:hypothetical protein
MGATGLSMRPLTGKRPKIAFIKTRCITPLFHKEKNVSYVSLVATITLGEQALTLLLLTTSSIPFKSEELVNLRI